MVKFKPTKYVLQCMATGERFEDSGWVLASSKCNIPSLVRTVYENRQFNLRKDLDGFYQFADWLPIKRTLSDSASPVTYKSTGLASVLGLENLYITFSGYWPERGAGMKTCSFKETEAYSVCARLAEDNDRILVVASAGNTARAFANVCSENNIPLLVAIPEENIDALWFEKPLNDCVKVVATPKGTDYYDAIAIGDIICGSPRFLPEGGAKNVARRDGMGTTVLSATTFIGRIPDCYFQAIGSGTGTIAAWECNLRLIEDGRYGTHKMRLYPSQNIPFTPMYDAWKAGSRELFPSTAEEARQKALQITAKVLSNRKPPYSLCGGLFDALKDSGGDMETGTNEDIIRISELFEKAEGIDIHPAAAIAIAGLEHAIAAGKVSKDETIMLNITGGGEKLFKKTHEVFYKKPDLILHPEKEDKNDIINTVEHLFRP
ncbi:cysteate synthase [Muribaculum sp. An289]|uniref:cysteate synthase n=1 Tax=unclassified Muribaculum TaxID=2622126 RepID=UPI000B3A3460|nr:MULTISPECIES: cysteate synthase [unclassified Muribaculum]OUO36813.1 cysteate synthase [Muribaculum sp. An289]OUO42720.1 cysteate synthase [Muribaculum sp. An287]